MAFSLGREQLRKLRLATQGCTPLRGCRVANSLRSPCHPTTPSLRCSPPPPSLAFSVPPPSLGQKAVFGTAAQSQAFFVRCRQSRPLWFQLPQWLRRRLTPLAFSSVGRTPFVKHSYAGLHSTSGVSGVRLRFAQPDARHALSSAAALLRCASLSLCPLGRSEKRCLGTATQSLGVFVRCRLTPSALVPAP